MESKTISDNVMRHIRAGQMIAAIKALRAEHGLSLKAAKQVVEQLARSPHSDHSQNDRDNHSSASHTAMRPKAEDTIHSSLPDYVVPRKPFLPQLVAFIVVVAFLYFLLLG